MATSHRVMLPAATRAWFTVPPRSVGMKTLGALSRRTRLERPRWRIAEVRLDAALTELLRSGPDRSSDRRYEQSSRWQTQAICWPCALSTDYPGPHFPRAPTGGWLGG